MSRRWPPPGSTRGYAHSHVVEGLLWTQIVIVVCFGLWTGYWIFVQYALSKSAHGG